MNNPAEIKTSLITKDDLSAFDSKIQKLLIPGLVLNDIKVSPSHERGKGVGSRAMLRLVEMLDHEKLSCILDPFSYEVDWGNNIEANERLEKWYSKFGFKTDWKCGLMYRVPR